MTLGVSEPQRIWMITLLLIWFCLLFGGFAFGKENAEHTHRMPTWTRMVSSLTLVVAVWSWWLFTRQNGINQLPLCIALGMTLGFMGDIFMANLIPIGNYVFGGIAAFGLGHIAYILGLVSLGIQFSYTAKAAFWISLITCLIIGAGAWYFVVYRERAHDTLHLAALPYSLLLSATVGVASGFALQNVQFVPLAIGAGLFLVSDLILATQLFNNTHFRFIGDVVWFTYGPGQMLIVFGLVLPVLF